jgi:hypothetical protein
MRRSWVGNCIAVGLASGFVEPLEAIGIWFIERSLQSFLGRLVTGPEGFNEDMRSSYEEIRDLILMHYL